MPMLWRAKVAPMISRRIKLYWLRQDIICLIVGHTPQSTEEGTWCERCFYALDDKAHQWEIHAAQS
jgi:uncharacterized protein YhbP (UPF0306 family)